ncbi:ATP-dependent zinc protease family protein [Ectothiorhodospira lacustris]|uniref:ATP-dependent zinc protease family protein n=1 Tax=Ectothiorhodospira lacustris TaxID=2899127 RepID=UPI001EE78D44|nr:RimK/LysX family protein [Ectothiorhodospira lacustris]MCG5500142.1 RimK/LysX family protein [Ectothiorhodospira lacustris]MCG5510773.1 RimK/LysX family protein [Ectothiorhodospira lacustris]MCG5522505.1 RimK/LysX family protein [Ectothiorhodospira lacustris]
MHHPRLPTLVAALCLLLFPIQVLGDAEQAPPEQQRIMGWVERVEILPEGIQLKAKMDTGATTSSLNALNKKIFERDGREWIAFDIIDPEDEQNTVRIEREIARYVRIIRHDGNHQRRPVVRIGLCMGEVYREAEMSLIDRTQLTYQALVGRNHMKEVILVDSSRTRTQTPACTPQGLPPEDAPPDTDTTDLDIEQDEEDPEDR